MLRIFLFTTLFFLNLYACKGGYHSCQRKIIDSKALVNQTIKIPISKKETLLFTQDKSSITEQIIKQDPFLSLYLVKSKKYFRYPFKFNKHQYLGVASVNEKLAQEGKIKKHQIGLNKLALFNDAVFTPSLLLTSCCSLEGLVTQRGIIEKDYLKNFIDSKEIVYGDIGVRLEDYKGLVRVFAHDPFMKNNQLKKDDIILSFDAKKVRDSATLMKKILFSKVGTSHKLKVKRQENIITINATTQKRYGGGYISDTFLEQKGLYFDKNLSIIRIEKHAQHFGLKIGDKILKANDVKVDSQQLLIQHIGNFKDSSLLLIQRAGFQFFVHVN